MSEHDFSPDVFRPDAGVRRLNRRPLALVVVGLAVVVGAIAFGLAGRAKRIRTQASARVEHAVKQPATSAAAALSKDMPKTGPIPEPATPARFRDGPPSGLIAAAVDSVAPIAPAPSPGAQALEESRRRLVARREQMAEAALTSVTRIATLDGLSTRAASRATSDPVMAPVLPASSSAALARTTRTAAGAGGLSDDANRQGEKIAFAEQRRTTGYLAATRQAPLSPFELKAGTVIPAVLITGADSDLPGQLSAQVTQNVFDSATGRFLLVPQGAKLVGVYDSRISVGQSRVQVAWTRLNFPDGSTLDLGGMPGTDQAGYTGFNDRVNNHAFRIFRDALMLSMISAGSQLSQPQAHGTSGQITPDQQIAAAMGQQFGAAGMELTRRNLQIQPTLEIRPGYRFTVMVNRDIVLPRYLDPES